MSQNALEQHRLEARAQAMAEAASTARFASKTGQDPVKVLDSSAHISQDAVDTHIKLHGEYIA